LPLAIGERTASTITALAIGSDPPRLLVMVIILSLLLLDYASMCTNIMVHSERGADGLGHR
jgi:hypothetical protein